MFSKISKVKKYQNHQIIDIDQLVNIIKDNPYKDDISRLRGLKYKSIEYSDLKDTLPCIFVNGVFSGLKNKDIISKNNLLYFDIDGLDLNQIQSTINNLNNNFPIYLICKSVGGKGISFFVSIDIELTPDNFKEIYDNVKLYFISKGFNVDGSAGGLTRKWFISSDRKLIYNPLSVLNYRVKPLGEEGEESIHLDDTLKRVKVDTPHLDDTSFNKAIPIEKLKEQIKLKTVYDKEINGRFVIDEIDYYKIFKPKVINDGYKHSTYISMINGLLYLNPQITKHQVFSYLYDVNYSALPPMEFQVLKQLVNNMVNIIRENGVLLKLDKKLIHYNTKIEISDSEKESIGRKVSANRQVNKTINRINESKERLISKGIKPTQKNVCKDTGLGIATIKRRWKEELRDPYDISEYEPKEEEPKEEEPKEEKKKEEYQIPSIEWDDMFKN